MTRLSLLLHADRDLNIPLFYQYLRESTRESVVDTFILVFYLRDCRGGKGERELGRKGLVWLFLNYPDQFMKVLPFISEYGRWDDYLSFFPTILPLTSVYNVKSNFLTFDLDLVKLRYYQQQIVQFVSSQLRTDRKAMLQNRECSLAAKWLPSENSALDRKYGVHQALCTALRRTPKYLRKYYLTPLRQFLRVTETYMCMNRWADIDYNIVPNGALQKYDSAFQTHDGLRYTDWKNYRQREKRVPLPYEVVANLRSGKRVAKVWEQVKTKYGVKNWAVIVDTSSSMYVPDYKPYDMAVSLGLLSKLVFNYSTKPSQVLLGDTEELSEKWDKINEMSWEGEVNMEKVYELLVETEVEKVVCITDGEVVVKSWKRVDENYKSKGKSRPPLLFWNVTKGMREENKVVDGCMEFVYKVLLEEKDLLTEVMNDNRYKKIREILNSSI